jgi:septal ring factor EnvC (AmiA/AmiB activator)
MKLCIAVLVTLAAVGAWASSPPDQRQLDTVRQEIRRLEQRLADLEREAEGARLEEERLGAELQLAEARVRELELQLATSRDEIVRLRAETEELGHALEARREGLRRHLEVVALLGRPAALELMADAARGGHLGRAAGTLAVLTEGQLRLVHEYDELRRQRTARLADLSRALESARQEAATLVARREELDEVKTEVEQRRRRLEQRRRSTDDRLVEMREREQALENLMVRLAAADRLSGTDDMRRFRGALPWPATGRVVRTFGRHYLPKYSTYTVNNGVRMDVAGGAAVTSVYPGVVAFARFFKGYGNMVVLDHGHGVYSLAAGLATIHVRLDQTVTMGTRLGLASPPSEDGNLYFEIRVDDEPQDPMRWLTLEEVPAR